MPALIGLEHFLRAVRRCIVEHNDVDRGRGLLHQNAVEALADETHVVVRRHDHRYSWRSTVGKRGGRHQCLIVARSRGQQSYGLLWPCPTSLLTVSPCRAVSRGWQAK